MKNEASMVYSQLQAELMSDINSLDEDQLILEAVDMADLLSQTLSEDADDDDLDLNASDLGSCLGDDDDDVVQDDCRMGVVEE